MRTLNKLVFGAALLASASVVSFAALAKDVTVGVSWSNFQEERWKTDEAAIKLLFLVLHRAEKEWIMPAREWTMAKAQFAILFGERFAKAQA